MLQDITRERLLKLCDYMESLPDDADQHFSMKSFVRHDGTGHRHETPRNPKAQDFLTCGTSACALGWACTMPEFADLGLYLNSTGYRESVEGHAEVFPGLEDEEPNDGDCKWAILFEGWNRDATPKAWATRARALIKSWTPEPASP